MTKSNIPNTPLYAHIKLGDYDAQVTLSKNSVSLQIHLIVVFSFALGSHKVSPTDTMVKRTSRRSGDGYLKSSTQTLIVVQKLLGA
jgi:hypothetical protein